jgi:hypothetical protein
MPEAVDSTVGGWSQYSGTFGMIVSAGGAVLVSSRTTCPALSEIVSVTGPDAGPAR